MIYVRGILTLNTDSGDLVCGKKKARLTEVEGEILAYFMREPGRIYTREELAKYQTGYTDLILSNAVDVHIKNIRRKLGAKGKQIIQTIRGKGYRGMI